MPRFPKIQVESFGAYNDRSISLKYTPGEEPVINGIERVSKPGLRQYCSVQTIPRVFGGMGVSILSTSRGIMTGREAKNVGVGGEVLCNVW